MADGVSFFGLGKLGLPMAALIARSGLRTLAIDVDPALVARLQAGAASYAEPGLNALLAEAAPWISYTTRAQRAAETDASIILVPTPSDPDAPRFSSSLVEQACRDLCEALKARAVWRYHLIVISSTLFPGTMADTIVPLIEDALGRRAGRDFGIAYVPDFVALGEVVRGFRQPSFLLVGSDDERASTATVALFRRVVEPGTPVRVVPFRDAELAKISSNVFLCLKVSFGNFLSQLGERLGGIDLDAITDTLALDPRIGAGFLRGGSPYGGTCLPRDIDAFVALAQSVGLECPPARAAKDVNAAQYDLIEQHVLARHTGCVALLGLSFKTGTTVTTGSPALELAGRIARHGIKMTAFDPSAEARDAARAILGSAITCHDALDECLVEADTILICNPEPAFRDLASRTPADRRIIDPWGCVPDEHPGLVRIGRVSGGALARAPFGLQIRAAAE